MTSPSRVASLTGSASLSASIGVNYWFSGGKLAGTKLGVEYKKAIYQDVEGPQLAQNDAYIIGLQKSF